MATPPDSTEQSQSGTTTTGKPPDPPADAAAPKESEQATSIKKGEAFRWQDQCFLIDGWEVLRDLYKDSAFYKNLIPVQGHPSQVISTITGEPGMGTFFHLTPAQLALLVPTIKLYVVEYNVSGGDHREGELKELNFEDFTREKDIQDILTSASGRGSGAGIKSFSYTFDGKDPATIDKSITASLKMLFTDVSILTRVQPNGASFIDLVTRVKKQIPTNEQPDPPDLGNPSSFCVKPKTKAEKQKTSPSNVVLNPEYRRIKAKIGWAPPRGQAAEQFLSESFYDGVTIRGVTKMLERMQLELFLEMTTHSIDFKNDGRLELTVNYRASIEGDMLSPEANLFHEITQKIKKLESDKQEKKEEIEQTTQAAAQEAEQDADTVLGSVAQAVGLADTAEEIKQEAQKEKQKIDDTTGLQTDMLKYKMYQQFMEKLIQNNSIYSVTVQGEDLKKWMGVDPNAAGAKGDYAQARQAGSLRPTAASILKKSQTKFGRGGTTSAYSTMMQGLKNAQKNNDAEDAKDSQADAAKEVKQATQKMAEDTSTKPPLTERKIHYLYLGDILDVAMTIFANNLEKTRESKVRMMVSRLSFINPETGKPREVNICHIPVALDEFIVWYTNNVIKPMRKKYMILDFIQDLLRTLVSQSLGFHCFGNLGRGLPELNIIPIQYPLTEKGEEPITRGMSGAPKDRYPTVGYNKLQNIFTKNKQSEQPATSYVNYVVLHASVRSAAALDPTNIKADEDMGIYHLGLGLDRGIVKEIKFKASKMRYAAETRIIDQGMANLGLLFEKYDADVVTYGCPLFKTGQYIYLDPKTMGVSSDIARLLGLGGYYVVVKVNGELDASGYSLDLTAKFQNNGLCGDLGDQPPESDSTEAALAASDGAESNQPVDPSTTQMTPTGANVEDMPSTADGVSHDTTPS